MCLFDCVFNVPPHTPPSGARYLLLVTLSAALRCVVDNICPPLYKDRPGSAPASLTHHGSLLPAAPLLSLLPRRGLRPGPDHTLRPRPSPDERLPGRAVLGDEVTQPAGSQQSGGSGSSLGRLEDAAPHRLPPAGPGLRLLARRSRLPGQVRADALHPEQRFTDSAQRF